MRGTSRSLAAVRLAGLALVPALVVAGCAGPSRPAHQAPAAVGVSTVAPADAPCANYQCHPGPAQALTGGYTVRLWLSSQPTTSQPTTSQPAGSQPATNSSERSTPVVELSRDGSHVSWWIGRIGFGWAASLHCLATASEPNCVVTSAVGAHAGSAEVLLLRNGSLTAPATASAVFDSGEPVAADLDHDGRLDVVGLENDYRPNFATGHNFWATYRLVGSSLRRTGCRPAAAGPAAVVAAPPTGLLTGRCPTVAQG